MATNVSRTGYAGKREASDSGVRRTTCGVGIVLATLVLLSSCRQIASTQTQEVNLFYSPPADRGANLPATGIYPQGRRLAFMGYSGVPGRDLANGFTVAGPVYGNQMPYLEQCFSNHWPVIAHVGPNITFNDKATDKYKFNEETLRVEVSRQVRELAPHSEIVWWAVHPEELRFWRKDEMRYLDTVCAAIRQNDPLKRPVYLCNPNHRDASSLTPVAKQVDVVGKGCYVNSCGKKRDRAWVAWSIRQELEAIRLAGRPGAIPLLMPELCGDPDPGEDKEIRAWVRHDVYLGMASGAKGVLIWSLFKRGGVKRSWQLWYDAYAECARELNGERGLAQVFLFGEPRSDLKVTCSGDARDAKIVLGGNDEPGTTSEQERARRTVKQASWTSAEFAYGDSRWLFLVNSANTSASFKVSGCPKYSHAQNAFDGTAITLDRRATSLTVELPSYGVIAIRFSKTDRK